MKGRKFEIYPDFVTGGEIDVSNYNDGKRGGRVKVRAKINQLNKNTLVISQIPFTTTSTTLIESIIKVNEKGKIKIKKIEDNTSDNVEILIHLPNGVSPDKTIDALFAFTHCEVSISPLGCVIENHKPVFSGVSEILQKSVDLTRDLLRKELEVKQSELDQLWHSSTLEKIFIENRIYRLIEEKETWDEVLDAIYNGLKPFVNLLKKGITQDDIVRLTEIKIKRISKYDIDKADKRIKQIEDDLEIILDNLNNLTSFTIDYFKNLKKKYAIGNERKTEIKIFDDVDVKKVVARNTKLYINRNEGFIGTSLKKDEYVEDCSDIDDIIVFTEDGKMIVTKIDKK